MLIIRSKSHKSNAGTLSGKNFFYIINDKKLFHILYLQKSFAFIVILYFVIKEHLQVVYNITMEVQGIPSHRLIGMVQLHVQVVA